MVPAGSKSLSSDAALTGACRGKIGAWFWRAGPPGDSEAALSIERSDRERSSSGAAPRARREQSSITGAIKNSFCHISLAGGNTVICGKFRSAMNASRCESSAVPMTTYSTRPKNWRASPGIDPPIPGSVSRAECGVSAGNIRIFSPAMPGTIPNVRNRVLGRC
jgi:hypothetical protein